MPAIVLTIETKLHHPSVIIQAALFWTFARLFYFPRIIVIFFSQKLVLNTILVCPSSQLLVVIKIHC